jgi:hypothetical protein
MAATFSFSIFPTKLRKFYENTNERGQLPKEFNKRGKWFQGGLKAERARCLSEAKTSAGFYASERDALGERATLKSSLPSDIP